MELNEISNGICERREVSKPLPFEISTSDTSQWLGAAVPQKYGGSEATVLARLNFYFTVARSDLTKALLISQRDAAVRWIVDGNNQGLSDRLLPQACSKFLLTQAVSHIAPSQHRNIGGVQATPTDDGYILNGVTSWVSGISYAEYLITGAKLSSDDELIVCIPLSETRSDIIKVPYRELLALSDSDSFLLKFNNLFVPFSAVVTGPRRDVIAKSASGNLRPYPTLHSSAIALGHAAGCIDEIRKWQGSSERQARIIEQLILRLGNLKSRLDDLAAAEPSANIRESFEGLRTNANVIALQASDTLLAFAKGRGFIRNTLPERYVREARFFLVWGNTSNVIESSVEALMVGGGGSI